MSDSFSPTGRQRVDVERISGLSPEIPPPAGCKDYWFNSSGNFSTDKMRKDETVFHCVAINDKNAKLKFEKYLKTLNA